MFFTVIDFLDYPPSSIAAAAVLCATDQNMEDQELSYFHKRVSKVSLILQFQIINNLLPIWLGIVFVDYIWKLVIPCHIKARLLCSLQDSNLLL